MIHTHVIEFKGCMPEPLMSYLKALGVFRLVVQQHDSQARAWWQTDTFFLQSTLDRDALLEFFLHAYRPTPIVSPWNGGSGFHLKDNSAALSTIQSLETPRFQLWQEVIAASRQILVAVQEQANLSKKEQKEWILAQCRMRFPDAALDWLDAAYVLTRNGVKFPPLLGTGGNDGRLEFSNNFMQNVVLALSLDKKRFDSDLVYSRLTAALFQEGSPHLVRNRSTGFYNPGSVGGANASVGFSGEAVTNPWDFVLMFEGALLFAGSVSRRLSAQATTKAVFPFTVDNSASGYGTSADVEFRDGSRAEFWAPLWHQPARLGELAHLASEGRAQLGRRQGTTGSDFARAIAGLGTERGVAEFHRYGFLVRNGLAYLAAPLGRFYVSHKPKTATRANVLFDLDRWLDRLRREVPGRGTVLSPIEGAIIEFCRRGQPRDLQEVLIAVGRAEQWVAKSSLRETLRPIPSLSAEWLYEADDGTAEFRLARALATIHGRNKEDRPIREYLEPVTVTPRIGWKVDSTSFVWTTGNVLANMIAVLQRCCLESCMHGHRHAPIEAAYWSQLQDIADFLHGTLDLQRIADLVLPLSFVRYPRQSTGKSKGQHSRPVLPVAYATMKLTLLPGEFVWTDADPVTDIWLEPNMLTLLRAGRVRDAYQVACRRLKASGLRPLSNDPGIPDRSDQGRRLAAALLFPVGKRTYAILAEHALLRTQRNA